MAKKAQQRKTFTTEQILDYMDCSLCYHLKHEKKLILPAETFLENKNLIQQQCVQETIRYYYLEHQQGRPPSLKKVYDKFYSLWMEKTDTLEQNSIFTRPLEEATRHAREERSRFITKGYETLKTFYGENARLKQAILAVNHPYQIVTEKAIITGSFDLIREVIGKESKRREIEVVSFQMTKRKPDEAVVKQDFVLTTMHYAFYETFQTAPDNFVIKYLNRGEELIVTRDLNDYKRMMSVIEGFALSVDTLPPFPRPGAHFFHSPYKTYCDNYQF